MKYGYPSDELPPRTSETDPLLISEWPVSSNGSKIGLTMRPGRVAAAMSGGHWKRDLEEDMKVVQAWKPDVVIDVTAAQPGQTFNLSHLTPLRGIALVHAYHCDYMKRFNPVALDAINEVLNDYLTLATKPGGRPHNLLITSEEGLHRGALVVAYALLKLGRSPDKVINIVNKARPDSIDCGYQFEYLRELHEELLESNQ